MTKLLILTAELPPQPGGIGNHTHHLASYLGNHNYHVSVIADVRSQTGEEEFIFDSKQTYSVKRIKRESPIFLTYLRRIIVTYNLLKNHDLLIVSGKFPIWLGGVLRLLFRKKIVAVVHGSEIAKNNYFTNFSLQRVDRIVAVSNYTRLLLSARLQKKTAVIPNGYEIDHKNVRDDNKLNELRIITVGNVTQRKGQHNVIKALPALLQIYPDLKYDIVGIPTNRESLMEMAEKLGVTDAVVFHGKVSESKKVSLLSKATIFVMLSEPTKRNDVEGFGIAILEANALGLPAIGSLGCGIEDAISQKVSGELILHNNTQELVSALRTILDNYNDYSNNAIEWSKKFTWETVVIKYLAVLKL